MLNGLRVDFDKAQWLICKKITPHALDYGLICLKYMDSFVKAALILTIELRNRTVDNVDSLKTLLHPFNIY
jgi:hypothetical protein